MIMYRTHVFFNNEKVLWFYYLLFFSRHEPQTHDPEIQQRLKSYIKRKHQYVFEGFAKQGNPTFLNQIYTELYITEGGNGEISNEHEFKRIEKTLKVAAGATIPIKCNDIFRACRSLWHWKNSLCAEVHPGLGWRETESGRPAHISTSFQRAQSDEGQNTQSFRSSSCLFPWNKRNGNIQWQI